MSRILPVILLTLGAVPVAAQTPGDTTMIVRGVIVERHGIFEEGEEASWWARVANALHVTTRRRIVEREILFRAGEPFDSSRVAETARNLRGLGVFRRVLIDSIRTDSGLVLRVTTKDGWSIRPTVDLSKVGAQTAWAVGLEELNLFGNAAIGSLTYSDHPDRILDSLADVLPALRRPA
jgi:outer membrane protein assembly factor BamA